jgi:hypothetical protein
MRDLRILKQNIGFLDVTNNLLRQLTAILGHIKNNIVDGNHLLFEDLSERLFRVRFDGVVGRFKNINQVQLLPFVLDALTEVDLLFVNWFHLIVVLLDKDLKSLLVVNVGKV